MQQLKQYLQNNLRISKNSGAALQVGPKDSQTFDRMSWQYHKILLEQSNVCVTSDRKAAAESGTDAELTYCKEYWNIFFVVRLAWMEEVIGTEQ